MDPEAQKGQVTHFLKSEHHKMIHVEKQPILSGSNANITELWCLWTAHHWTTMPLNSTPLDHGTSEQH